MRRATDLIVVRHGETAWNREGRIQGHRDSPLTERGLAQARATAARLAAERVGALWASDLGRALRTAEAVAAAAALPIRTDAGLRERAYGIFEGKTWDEIVRDHAEEARRARELPSHAVPAGESLEQFRDRVVAAFSRIADQAAGTAVAVVTHGGVLGVLYREAMGIPLEAARSYTTVNAGVNRLRFEAGRFTVVGWGEVEHLAADSLDDA